MSTADKIYLTYEDVHKDVEHLYERIKMCNYYPQCIIAIGTGGFIPARMFKSFMDIPILCMSVSHYQDELFQEQIKILQTIHKDTPEHEFIKGKDILVIDELDDTRSTLQYITTELLTLEPSSIAVGVLHNKIKSKLGTLDDRIEYFNSRKVEDKWIVYPWENSSFINKK